MVCQTVARAFPHACGLLLLLLLLLWGGCCYRPAAVVGVYPFTF